MLFTDPIRGCRAILGACLAFLYYRHMAYKKFGGITGDLAGFFLQLCELMMALGVVIVDVLI
jgi:adenosylcobinamide-GDP ribazoletransferase